MDPLSLTAGVIAAIGAASKTCKALNILYNLKNAPEEILELINEVKQLRALLGLVQKAIEKGPSLCLSREDEESLRQLIESAREPLDQLDSLISASSCTNLETDTIERRSSLTVSYISWFKSRKTLKRIRNRTLQANRNINTALAALSNIRQQQDGRLLLSRYYLKLSTVDKSDSKIEAVDDESRPYQQFGHTMIECMNEKTPPSDTSTSSLRKNCPKTRSNEEILVSSGRGIEALDGYASHPDPLMSFSTIRTSVSRGACNWGCHCQCHLRKAGETPRWLTELLGAFFYSHARVPILRLRSCDYDARTQQESASYQLTYHFPRWLMKRPFIFTASYKDLGGMAASWSIGFPRSISSSHQAWQYIERNQSQELRQMLRDNLIFGNDLADDDGTSLLIYALKHQNNDIIELLLQHGANPHLVDQRGISAYAYAQSNLLIARPSHKPLWAASMDLNLDEPSVNNDLSLTPLHYVVIGLEQANLRQQLRLNRTSLDVPDALGRSVLHWAVLTGSTEAIQILLDHGASPRSVDREMMTPLHAIFLAPPSAQALCGQYLLNAGAEIDASDFWKRTPLRIAVGHAGISLDLLDMFVNNGADVNSRDIYCQSPLLKSIRGRPEATQLLLSHGADTEAQDEFGNTPVLEAIYRDRPQQLELLLRFGAQTDRYFELKPGRRARDGRIHLLDFVVWYGSVEIMRVLEKMLKRRHFYLIQPLDRMTEYQDFRLANGRKAGPGEHEAFGRMLSHMGFSYGDGLTCGFWECDGDDVEIFFDAHDSAFANDETV